MSLERLDSGKCAVNCFAFAAKPHSDDGGAQGSAKCEAPIPELLWTDRRRAVLIYTDSTVRQHLRKLLSSRRTQDERIDSDCSRSAEP